MSAPPEPRWRRLPEERPQQIIQAAIDVFDQKGLVGARLEDIAKQAGVSKGTIYLYFPNKEELFREMVRNTIVQAIVVGEQLPELPSARDQLKLYMERFWEFVNMPAYATIFRITIGELYLFPDLTDFYYTEVVQRVRAFVGGIVRRGIASGEFRSDLDAVTAARMMSALFSTSAMWCRKRQFFPKFNDQTDEQVRDELIDFYLHALRA